MERLFVELRTPSAHFPLATDSKRAGPKRSRPSGGPSISKSGWTLVRVSSESKFNGKTGDRVFDGDAGTWWHSEWRDQKPNPPHDLVIDLGQEQVIAGVRFLARQDQGKNGMIREFELYAIDGENRRKIVSGELEEKRDWQERTFESVRTRRIELRVLSEITGRPFGSLAELELVPAPK